MTLDEIAESSGVLMCYTDKIDCCRRGVNKSGEWYYPNGLQVGPVGDGGGFYRSRSRSVIQLHRKIATVMPIGVFHCEVPDSSGANRSIYVGVYPQGQGNV